MERAFNAWNSRSEIYVLFYNVLCIGSADVNISTEFFISSTPLKKGMTVRQRWKNSTIIQCYDWKSRLSSSAFKKES